MPPPTSAPSPTPAPAPPPAPTSATDPNVSYTFPATAAKLTGDWDLATKTVFQGAASDTTLSIRYDAAAGSYTVSDGGIQDSFGSSDVLSKDDVEARYSKSGTSTTSYLTLVKTPYSNVSKPRYVAMGFWQRNTVTGSNQNVFFDSFIYGLPSPAAVIPRSGQAAFGIDVFGIATKPGTEPVSFQGGGTLSVDFLAGVFSSQAYVTEYGLVTDSSISGGGIELRSGGSLSSADGKFSGTAAYGSGYGVSAGTIAGQFFGPNGDEIGASFNTSGADGLVAVGSLVGSKDTSLVPEDQTLTHLTHEHRFYTLSQSLVGSLTWLNAETFDFGAATSDMLGGRFTANDKIASSNPNFVKYSKSGDLGYGPTTAVLELFKPGPANTQIALTYASFGHYSGTGNCFTCDSYFTYGFQTGANFLPGRTGTATYSGVLYGTGLNSDASHKYGITGTSSFLVDFSNQNVNGTLSVAGKETTLGSTVNFGDYALSAPLGAYNAAFEGPISRGASSLGTFYGQFYGPDEQELGGTFYFNAPAGSGDAREVGISGVTVAKRN